MKSIFLSFALFVAFFNINIINAQKKITEKFKKETIFKIDTLLQENYIFTDQAQLIIKHLKTKLKNGEFKKYELLDSFAIALTKEIRFVNNDKHLGIWPTFDPPKTEENSSNNYQIYLKRYSDTREQSNGFKEVKILDKNVGYLDIRFFLFETNQTIDSYMNLLSNTDAIIIDLQNNGGGNPRTVNYLSSYFLESQLLTNVLYFRNRKDEIYTHEVNGKKLIDVPLIILTGPKTFSGAEEFSYNMQTQKRATLVGQTTAGAANPGDVFRINKNLEIFIPTGTGTNPITKTNWEGVGVIPEIKTSAETTYDKAVELASKLAQEYRNKKASQSKALYDELQSIIDNQSQLSQENDNVKIDQQIVDILTKGNNLNLFSENDINDFGSQSIKKNPFIAESILKGNTILHPKSPIALLNYGDMLELNHKKDQALLNFAKAVTLADEQKAPYLEGLKMRYEKAKNSK